MFHLFFLVGGLELPQEIQAVSRLCLVAMNHQSHNESNDNKYDKIFAGQKFLRQFPAKKRRRKSSSEDFDSKSPHKPHEERRQLGNI